MNGSFRRFGMIGLVTTLVACGDHTGLMAPDVDAARQDSYWVPGDGEEPFSVYTQNVYLGGDTGPLFSLDLTNIPAVLQAANAFWAEVQQSDIPGRAAAIVDEIAARRPHLVGLQEVVRFAVVDATNGQIVAGADPLASIEAEIAARGLPYEVVRVQENLSGALPLAIDFTVGQPTRVLAFTDRVAALRRTDVPVRSSDQGTYAARLPLGPFDLTRGWIRVSTERDGVPYHFVTTHLEIQAIAPVQAAQAGELMGSVLSGLDGVTVLAGDLNSDAEAEPGDPSWTPTYGQLVDAGFEDAWETSGQPGQEGGFTCCHDIDLRNATPDLETRVDFILVRGPGGGATGALRAEMIFDEAGDRIAGGLWPSDHAGLFGGLRLPAGLYGSPAGF